MPQKILVTLFLIFCFSLTFSNMKSSMKGNGYIQKQSVYDFEKTVETIKKRITEKNGTIFSIADHKKNAENVKLNLRPTTVIIFGNPTVGTLLMQENQKISFELPLKISVFEDEKGNVQVVYYDVRQWKNEFDIKNTDILEKISKLYEFIVPTKK